MYIAKHMSAQPLTIAPATLIPEAREILQAHHFRHLPVVDEGGRLLGMVTDRDIRSAYPSPAMNAEERERLLARLGGMGVGEIMSRAVHTLTLFSTLDDALLLLERERVGALPVVDAEGRVVGVFSIRDLMRAYKGLFGLGERGSALVEVLADGLPRPLSRIAKVLEEHDIHFSRVIRKRGEGEADRIYVRVNTCNLHAVHKALAEGGFSVAEAGQGQFGRRV